MYLAYPVTLVPYQFELAGKISRMLSDHKSKRRNVLVFRGGTTDDENFEIDEDDFRAVDRIWNIIKDDGYGFDTTIEAVKEMVGINKDDKERRVSKFLLFECVDSLPKDIIQLDALEVLDLHNSNMEELPPWLWPILQNLKELNLSNRLSNLPKYIGNLKNLHTLTLSAWMTSLPCSIGKIKTLKNLNLVFTNLKILPNEICFLANLEVLDLSRSSITSLPEYIDRLQNLYELNLSQTQELNSIPDELGYLHKLEKLNLSGSSISSLPSSFGGLTNLNDLNLEDTKKLDSLPEIGGLQNLEKLNLCGSGISSLPFSLGSLTNLNNLNLRGSGIVSLPSSFGKLLNLKNLNIRDMKKLESLPNIETGELASLERLDASEVTTPSFSTFVRKLENLKNLDLFEVDFRLHNGLPNALGTLKNLPNLDLSFSSNPPLETFIGKLKNLIKLELCGVEGLHSIDVGDLVHLEELTLAQTEVSSLGAIGKLKNLTRLDLNETMNLVRLPEEINDLHKLVILDLAFSNVSSIPDLKLPNLRLLRLIGTSIDDDSSVPNQILWDLVRQCPQLGCFNNLHKGQPAYLKLDYELSLNRARSRAVIRDDTVSFPTALWPSVLLKAGSAFNKKYQLCTLYCGCKGRCYSPPLTQADAIFFLLEHGAKGIFDSTKLETS